MHTSGSLLLTTFYHMDSVAHSRYVEKMSSSLIYRFKTCPSSNNEEWGSLSIAHTAVIETDSCPFFILLWKDSSVLWNRQQVQVSKWLASFTNTASSKAEFVASSKLTLYEAKEELYFLSLIVYFYGALSLVINFVTQLWQNVIGLPENPSLRWWNFPKRILLSTFCFSFLIQFPMTFIENMSLFKKWHYHIFLNSIIFSTPASFIHHAYVSFYFQVLFMFPPFCFIPMGAFIVISVFLSRLLHWGLTQQWGNE